MVDLSGGTDGPIEHGFSNTVFIIPGIIFITLSDNDNKHNKYVVAYVNRPSKKKLGLWMDLLQGVKEMADESLNEAENVEPVNNMEDMPMPSVADLLKALDGMTGMSEEDKQGLRDQLTGQGRFSNSGGLGFQQLIIFLLMVLIISSVFVFFGYKLYKSLVDKERKRDEKRKMKQMKKKK